jgi:hypothetical protein
MFPGYLPLSPKDWSEITVGGNPVPIPVP